jgi:hypothetical protein
VVIPAVGDELAAGLLVVGLADGDVRSEVTDPVGAGMGDDVELAGAGEIGDAPPEASAPVCRTVMRMFGFPSSSPRTR